MSEIAPSIVNVCNAFIYFLFIYFGEGDYQVFRKALEKKSGFGIKGAEISIALFESFLNVLGEEECENNSERNSYVSNLHQEIFKKYDPKPIQLLIEE